MKGRILFSAVLLAGLAGGLRAESIINIGNHWAFETDVTFDMIYQGTGKARSVNYTYTQQLFPGFPGMPISGTTNAGELLFSIDGSNETVWSMDITQPASYAEQTYNAAIVIETDYMLALDRLYYQYGQYVASNSGSLETLTDAAAGFQIAIWELTYETGGFDVLSGSFLVNSSASATLANSWLGNMDNIDAPGLQRKILVNSSTMDVMHYQSADFPPIVPSIPEPLTMLSISLAGIAAGRYAIGRFKSKPQSC